MVAKRWYVVHVYSGFEKKVVQSIKEQVAAKDMDDLFNSLLSGEFMMNDQGFD